MNIKDYLDENNLRWNISPQDFSKDGYTDHIHSLNTQAKKIKARTKGHVHPTPGQKEFLEKFKPCGGMV